MEQHLADEERVALGLGVHRLGQLQGLLVQIVSRGVLHELLDTLGVEAREVEPGHPALPTEVTQDVCEWTAAIEVRVAVRRQDEHPERRD